MPKRSAAEAHLAAVVAAPKAEGAVKSRSGRTVKPKVWDDGTMAAPLGGLKEDAGELSPGKGPGAAAAADAADPDFSLEQAAASDSGRGSGGRGSGGQAPQHPPQHPHDSEEEEAYSDDSPRASVDGSQGGGSTGRARSGSVGRDEHGKFVSGPRPRGGRGGARGGRGEGGGIFKMAAVEVLRLEKRLMSTGEIARQALKRGLIRCTGKTPEATMASALYTDIKRKEGRSIFIRPHEGLFGLREWIEQGVAFQDEFAEELAKRARAAFGAFVGMPGMPAMVPALVDSDGVPVAPPCPPLMPYAGMPGMPLPVALSPHAAAAAAAAAAAGADSPDGLMELLSAAEELHKSSSKDLEEADVKYGADGTAILASATPEAGAPAAPAEQAAAEEEPIAAARMDAEQPASSGAQPAAAQAEAGPGDEEHEAGGGSRSQSHGQGPRGEDEEGEDGDEEGDAAAMLAAVAEAAAGQPLSRLPSDAEHAAAAALRGFPGFAMPEGPGYAGAQYPPPPYGYQYYPYGYSPAPGLPPLPKAQRRGAAASPAADAFAEADAAAAVAELAGAGSSGSLDLTVRGSSRPFAVLAAAGHGSAAALVAAAVEAEGQEQVNILNLPLPEGDPQAAHGGEGGAHAPPAALDPAGLKGAEAQVMRLERELGTSHPEVGKAYLSLSRLYLAGCEESASKQLAVAALSRSWEILNVCQLALKRQPTCTSSFAYLMDKLRPAEPPTAGAPQQRPLVEHAANGAELLLSPPAGPGAAPAAAPLAAR